jgi:hypothetical protein
MVQTYADAYADSQDSVIAAYLAGLAGHFEANPARKALLLDAARRLRERPATRLISPADAAAIARAILETPIQSYFDGPPGPGGGE